MTAMNNEGLSKYLNNPGQFPACPDPINVETELLEEKETVLDLGEQPIPDGIDISMNKYGYCLIATKPFKKGDIIYSNEVKTVPLDTTLYKFKSGGKEYISDCTNSVKFETQRCAYTFDGFMNHSCQQNTISLKKQHYLIYDQIASRDIKAGEQILCNYLHFDYECDGHTFVCQCGSEKCYGEIRGFRNLGLKDQVGMLDKIDEEMIEIWLEDNPDIVLIRDLKIPECIQLCELGNNKKLKSKKKFLKGQTIFKNTPLKIPQTSTLIIKTSSGYEQLDLLTHTINKGSYRQFLYFDSFMNHSCDPNSVMLADGDQEVQVCLRDIQVGEEITCDYGVFDLMNDAEEFCCQCRAVGCRGVVQGVKKGLAI